MNEYKKKGVIAKNTTAKELCEIAAFIAKHTNYPKP